MDLNALLQQFKEFGLSEEEAKTKARTLVKTFWSGLPSLGQKQYSASDPSVNANHEKATFTNKPFGVVQNLPKIEESSLIWQTFYSKNKELTWGSEQDIQHLVANVITDAIAAIGLKDKLKCFNELSIWRLRADIWIVVDPGGFPVGVVEVKKPGSDIMNSELVHGQIYDYMLRLKTFNGLQNVFGLVTTYLQWRFYWLPDCDQAAAATTVDPNPVRPKSRSVDEQLRALSHTTYESNSKKKTKKTKTKTKKENKQVAKLAEEGTAQDAAQHQIRMIYGSEVYNYDDSKLPELLGSLLFKMYHSPSTPVNIIDSARSYICMNKSRCFWTKKANFTEKFSLQLEDMPIKSAQEFTLLHDYRGGADGRVWLACTDTGRLCVIKFAQKNNDDKPDDLKKKLDHEASNWLKILGDDRIRVIQLAGDYALMMPYVCPITEEKGVDFAKLSPQHQQAIKDTLNEIANKKLYHGDLSWRHVGFLPASGKCVLIDLRNIRESNTIEEAKGIMYQKLNISL